MKPRAADAIVTMVTDHAVLRYLERRHGIDVEGARRTIQQHTSVALDHNAPFVIWDGLRFVIEKGSVVTALEISMRGEKGEGKP